MTHCYPVLLGKYGKHFGMVLIRGVQQSFFKVSLVPSPLALTQALHAYHKSEATLHHLSGLLSQLASWPQSTLVNIWNWTPPTAGSWRSQWWCYENWSLPFMLLLKVSAHMCWPDAMGALYYLSVYQRGSWFPCPNAPFFKRFLSVFSLQWWKFT
jgi:hypothetical protein